MLRVRHLAVVILALCAFVASALPGSAQEWPKLKPVTFIVPSAAGGSLDALARLIADHLSQKFDAKFIVEPRPGASGNIGGAIVARAPPDGYTFLVSVPGVAGNNKFTFASLPFDPETDFSYVTKLSEAPLALVVRKDFPAETFQEFLAYVRNNPGKVTIGNPGVGSMAHIAETAFTDQAKLDMTLVPYKAGAGAIIPDLLSGNLDSAMDLVGGYAAAIKDKRLKLIAIAAAQRSPLLPDVATMREGGIDFVAAPWFGFQGPKGLPADIVQKMNAAIVEFLTKDEKVRAYLASTGQMPAPSTPEAFQKAVQAEMAIWGPVIKKYNIKAE